MPPLGPRRVLPSLLVHVHVLVLVLSLASCGSPSKRPDSGDGGPDGGPAATLPPCEETEPEGTLSLDPVASTLVGSIESLVDRVEEPNFDRNPALEEGELHYAGLRMGEYVRGPGIERVRLTDLGGDDVPAERRSLAYFVHVSDLQLVDDESPNRLGSLDNVLIPSGLRPQEAYLPRALSALSRTLARIEPDDRPYDFGILTGDCTDSAQRNELRWVIATMDGLPGLHTDSGDDDDPLPGPDNDPKDPFDPTPFPAPWLYVPGNHDVLVLGNALVDERRRESALGTRAVAGSRDYRVWWAPPLDDEIPADTDRRPVDRAEIVAELLASPDVPGPVGHGYSEGLDLEFGANWVRDVVPGLLRIVAFDSSDATGGAEGAVMQSMLDEFLGPELDRAEADGVLVVLASHHATTSIDTAEGLAGDPIPGAVEPEDLEVFVASHANVIAWLVGHSHDNRIRAIHGAGPGAGYWEIMTSAVADWPSQARILELVDDGNGTLSLFATLVDFDEATCMERRYRRLALMDWAAGWTDDYERAPEHSNVELLVPVPPTAVEAVAAARAVAPARVESETTLLAGR